MKTIAGNLFVHFGVSPRHMKVRHKSVGECVYGPWPENGGPAWRIVVRCDDGENCPIPMQFGRERDAEAAAHSLAASGLTDEHSIVAYGKSNLRRLLVENLQW